MNSGRKSSLAAIETIARAVEHGPDKLVFVGGTVTALYPLEGNIRPTLDVDCVVDVTTTSAYYDVVKRLHNLGFKACTDEGAPLCRLVYRGILVDLVATPALPVGPTNRWYRDAVKEAGLYEVASDLTVLAIIPMYFVATKLEAFRSRGGGDFAASHDLEDVLTVLGGLPDLRNAIDIETSEVALALRSELAALAVRGAFIDAVPGHCDGEATGQGCADVVLDWLESVVAR